MLRVRSIRDASLNGLQVKSRKTGAVKGSVLPLTDAFHL